MKAIVSKINKKAGQKGDHQLTLTNAKTTAWEANNPSGEWSSGKSTTVDLYRALDYGTEISFFSFCGSWPIRCKTWQHINQWINVAEGVQSRLLRRVAFRCAAVRSSHPLSGYMHCIIRQVGTFWNSLKLSVYKSDFVEGYIMR